MMRTMRLPAIALVFALAGCSQLPIGRPTIPPKTVTVATIGDKPLPPVSGTPDAEIRAAVPESEADSPVDARGRLAGRVLDESGKPLPGAEVRLALDGAKSGTDRRTATDAAGRFAFNDLRRGGSYTLIAETPDEHGGYIEGRTRVSAPDTGVKITLKTDAPEARHVGRVSERTSSAPKPRVNEEDLPPPVESQDEDGAEPSTPTRGTSRPALWRGREVRSAAKDKTPARDAEPRAEPEETEDDGLNPLPPAIENASSDAEFTALPERPLARPTDGFAPAPAPAPGSKPDPSPDATSDVPPSQPETPPAQSTEAKIPTAVTSPSPAPDSGFTAAPEPTPSLPASSTAPAAGPATPSSEPSPSNSSPATTTDGRPAEAPAIESVPAAPPPANSPVTDPVPGGLSTKPRPTWGEVAAAENEAAPAPTTIAAASPEPARRPLVDRLLNRTSARRGLLRQAPAATPNVGATGSTPIASCRYLPGERRIADFRLYDLDGRPVRFQDLRADVVLLDFWGSWCGPCRDSIPQLVELRKRYPHDRLTIVGIAYEHGTPDENARAARRAAESMGINYVVLLAGYDGRPCPLQESLKVSQFPTLILTDAEGRILWRDTGNRPETFSRLERILESRAGRGLARR